MSTQEQKPKTPKGGKGKGKGGVQVDLPTPQQAGLIQKQAEQPTPPVNPTVQKTVNATDILKQGLGTQALKDLNQQSDMDFPVMGNDVDLSNIEIPGYNPSAEVVKTKTVANVFDVLNTGLRTGHGVDKNSLQPVEGRPLRIKVIRPIPTKGFKMNLDKYKDEQTGHEPMKMPGASYLWEPTPFGTGYKTGLEDKPETKARLEKAIGFSLDPDSDYYANLRFRLEDKPHGNIMNFDDSRYGAFYEVVFYAMTESQLISIGLGEYRNGLKPEAEWYVEDTELDAQIELQEIEKERKAFKTFEELTAARKRGIAKLLGLKVWGLGDDATGLALWKFIKTDAASAKLFMETVALRDDEYGIRVIIKDAIKHNVLRRTDTNAFTFKSVVVGTTEDQVFQKLALVENQDLLVQIKNETQLKAGQL